MDLTQFQPKSYSAVLCSLYKRFAGIRNGYMKRSVVRFRQKIGPSQHSSQEKICTMRRLSLCIAMKVFGAALSLPALVQAVMLAQLQLTGEVVNDLKW
jgi:hypothetical protein